MRPKNCVAYTIIKIIFACLSCCVVVASNAAPPLTMNPLGNGLGDGKSSSGELNSLEKALVLRKSSRQDFQSFKDDGGLAINSSWHGFSVSSVELEYKDGLVSFIHLGVNSGSTVATMNNLKNYLAKDCGADWKIKLNGNAYSAENESVHCYIESTDGRQDFHLITYAKN